MHQRQPIKHPPNTAWRRHASWIMSRNASYYSRLVIGAGALSCATAFAYYRERVFPSSVEREHPLFATGRTYQTPADIYYQKHKFIPPPRSIHTVLTRQDVPKESSGVLVVGDVHGCLDELQELHQLAVEANDNRQFEYVILVGDLVNKGPHSAEVVQFVQEQDRWLSVRGNHDNAALLGALSEEKRASDSRYAWVNDLTDQDVGWLADLPYTIRISASYWQKQELNNDVLIVHAGLVPGVALKDQTFESMVTLRQVSPSSANGRRLWSTLWKGPEHVIFGHDAKSGLQQHDFATGLDSGCCYGKKLTGILLPQRQLVSVQAREVYSPIVEKS